MALPPELRHDPNVTGSYANAAPSAPVDVVPIEEEVLPVAEQSSSKENDQSQAAKATAQKDGATTTSETKEDIQAWLDDILDA